MRRSTREGFEAAWRQRFERFAAQSDGWSASGLAARARRFAALWCGGVGGERWLDAGCGAGTYCRYLERQGVEVVGADYSFGTLQKAKKRLGEDVPLVLADVRWLPFESHAFDGALCFGVLQALADSSAALRELSSSVRPGGTVWVDALNSRCVMHLLAMLWRFVRGRRLHLRYESPRQVVAIMRACGLEEVRVYWMPILPTRFARFQQWMESPAMQGVLKYVPLLGPLSSHAFIATGRKPLGAGGGSVG